jgi:hypothetical protein
MKYKVELFRRKHEAGFIEVVGIVDGSEFGCDDYEASHCENDDGHYIGDLETAEFICGSRGIKPELAKASDAVCSIGFCEREQKWFGWSHRAMFGFGVGSEVKRGDCAYVPIDMEDARLEAIRFWSGDSHQNVEAFLTDDEEGKPCFDVKWVNSDDPRVIPNEKCRGKIGGVRQYPPEQFGKGEWVAKNLVDAKQMAIDFAESVS